MIDKVYQKPGHGMSLCRVETKLKTPVGFSYRQYLRAEFLSSLNKINATPQNTYGLYKSLVAEKLQLLGGLASAW